MFLGLLTAVLYLQCAPPIWRPPMPFHMQYSGLAPVSTYFRIQPAPLPEPHPCFPKSAAVETQLGSTSTAMASPEENEKALAVITVVIATADNQDRD